MDTEQYLKNLKKSYQESEVPEKLLSQGWQDLEEKINRLEQKKQNFYFFRPVAFAALLIIFLTGSFAGLAQASQDSLPGEPLYSVKRVSENIVSTATGNNLIKIDHRAREIIGLTKKGSENKESLEKTVDEYRQEVSDFNKSEGDSKELKTRLETHEEEFAEIRKDRSGSNSEKELDEAIEISKSGRGDGEETGEDRSGSNSGEN